MNILLTGGNGFIGKHLVRDLNNCGHKVFLLKSNISNYESLQKEIENLNFDTVIHLAGLSHVSRSFPFFVVRDKCNWQPKCGSRY